MARPTKGLDHVDDLQGDPDTKFRLKTILATITGHLLVEEAADQLDVGPTQFANLRRQMLQGALSALELRPGGRPRKVVEISEEEIKALRAENAKLQRELQEVRARVQLAVLPLVRAGTSRKPRTSPRPDPGG
jgi:transposase-like protein